MSLKSTDCNSAGRLYCIYGYGRIKYRDVNTCLEDKRNECLSQISEEYYDAPTKEQKISCAKKVGQPLCRAIKDLPECVGQVHTMDVRKSDTDYGYCLANRQWQEKSAGPTLINPIILLILAGGIYYGYKEGWFNKKIGLKI